MGIDQAARLNYASYIYSNYPNYYLYQVDQATCPGGRSNPSNEVLIYFAKNSVSAGTSYQAEVEYKDPYWNGNPWPCCGYGNGDAGKMGMSQYIDQCCFQQEKKDWIYGFFCSSASTTTAGVKASQCP